MKKEKATFAYMAKETPLTTDTKSPMCCFLTRLRKRRVLYENGVYKLQSQKNFSSSSYLAFILRMFVKGEKLTKKLRSKKDYEGIFEELKSAANIVLCLPLYVDGPPSHVLAFLEEAEKFFLKNNLHPNIYCVANNGFIEGRQNEPLMRVIENFCIRAGIKWRGGVGVGGGVMLNVTRIIFMVLAAVFSIQLIIIGVQTGIICTQEFFWLFKNAGLLCF